VSHGLSNADDLLQSLIFVLLTSDMRSPHGEIGFVEEFMHAGIDVTGPEGYAMATFQAAAEAISSLEIDVLLSATDEPAKPAATPAATLADMPDGAPECDAPAAPAAANANANANAIAATDAIYASLAICASPVICAPPAPPVRTNADVLAANAGGTLSASSEARHVAAMLVVAPLDVRVLDVFDPDSDEVSIAVSAEVASESYM